MFKRKPAAAICLAGVLTACPAVPAAASEYTDGLADSVAEAESSGSGLEEAEAAMEGITESDLLSSIKSSISESSLFSTGDLLESYGVSVSDDSLYDMSSYGLGSLDMSSLNLQYESLASSMDASYNAVDLSGYSSGCLSLFEDTYGDVLSSISYSEAEIPSGFDTSSMLSDAASQISSLYSSATGSETFTSVKNKISIDDIFAAASSGASSYTLASSAELSDTVSSLNAANSTALKNKYTASSNEVDSIADSYNYVKNAQFAFDQYTDLSGTSLTGSAYEGNISIDYDAAYDAAKEAKSNIGMSKTIKNAASTVASGVKNAAGTVAGGVKNAAGTVADGAKSAAGSIGDFFTGGE